MTHYDTLGVSRTADAAALRRAYLRLARAHHPDFHTDDPPAERRRHARTMQAVNAAWAVLGDPAARADYDRDLAASGRAGPGRGGGAAGARTGSGGARSGARGPTVPPGKGWTPRADDTGWQRDFAAWRAEDERLPEDAAGRSRSVVLTLPAAAAAVAAVAGFLGVVLRSRALLAVAAIAFFTAVTLFVVLPLFELTRGRADDHRRDGERR